VTIDGTTYPTRVETTTRRLETLSDVDAVPCGAGGASLRLRAGEHRLVMAATAAWRPVGAGLRADTATSIGGDVLAEPRVLQWGEESRAVALGARGGGSLLTIPENINAGWRATLAGKQLRAVQVDGWQQAFAVPAGKAGVVRLAFEPAAPYRLALWWGLAALVALVLLAIRFSRYDEPMTAIPAQPGRIVRAAGALVALTLLAGLPGLAVAAAAITARTALSRYGTVWAAASIAGFAIAGCVLIARPWGSASGYGADDLLSQLFCVVTIAMVVAPTAARRPARAAGGPDAPPAGTAATPAAD
jgi:arabinofuranan 3-O-arabinosyltransferase